MCVCVCVCLFVCLLVYLFVCFTLSHSLFAFVFDLVVALRVAQLWYPEFHVCVLVRKWKQSTLAQTQTNTDTHTETKTHMHTNLPTSPTEESCKKVVYAPTSSGRRSSMVFDLQGHKLQFVRRTSCRTEHEMLARYLARNLKPKA